MQVEWIDVCFQSSWSMIRSILPQRDVKKKSLRIFFKSFFAFTIDDAKVVRPEPKGPASTTLNSLADIVMFLLDEKVGYVAIRKITCVL